MAFKIAFASSDGKTVNQNFGRDNKFVIFRIKNLSAEFIELRENASHSNKYEHLDEAMNNSVELVSDCRAVFVSRIGYGALKVFSDKNIKVFEAPYFISDIISKLFNKGYEI